MEKSGRIRNPTATKKLSQTTNAVVGMNYESATILNALACLLKFPWWRWSYDRDAFSAFLVLIRLLVNFLRNPSQAKWANLSANKEGNIRKPGATGNQQGTFRNGGTS